MNIRCQKSLFNAAFFLSLILFVGASLSVVGQGFAQDLHGKIAAILPKPEEEQWLAVNWHIGLPEALRESELTGKPLLLWVMSGPVLGCT